MPRPCLTLRSPKISDGPVLETAQYGGYGFSGLPHFVNDDLPWEDKVAVVNQYNLGAYRSADKGLMPGQWLVADIAGHPVGIISIRRKLNDYLALYGGHIGYGVLEEHRYRGYASEMLRQGLMILATYGVRNILVTCDNRNVGSAKVIERNGGQLESLAREL